MKIAVFGAGGVGGYFGACLARAGHEVHFIARGRHAEAMREKGLTVRAASGEIRVERPSVTDNPASIGPVNLVLVCVKLWDTEAAAEACKALIGPETVVISLQNGVHAERVLSEALGPEHVVGGSCQISAAIAEPGVIQQTGSFARIAIGELGGERRNQRLERIAGALDVPGIELKVSDDINLDIWRKFALLAPFAGVTAYYREPVGVIREDPEKRARFKALVAEAVAVGRAWGVKFPPEAEETVAGFFDDLPEAMKASMLVDLERGNPLELDWLTGAVVQLGEAAGVDVTVSREVYDALKPYAEGGT